MSCEEDPVSIILTPMAARTAFDDVEFPSFESLPFRAGDPEGAIWGFYEKISDATEPDELGSLNLLTPLRILKAKEEIKLGKVCSLNWAVQKPNPTGYRRMGLSHRAFQPRPERFVFDDEIHMNTQSGSQWDGFRHWAYYKTGQFYNGVSVNEFPSNDKTNLIPDSRTQTPLRNGIHKFQGKIVGRGVLLDFYAYAQAEGIAYQANDQYLLTAAQLDACAEAQGITFKQGDILFVRMGWVHWHEHAAPKERWDTLIADTRAIGLRQDLEEVKWLWDHHFAAVACDAPAFEARPTIQEWNLHDYLLALWGTPIGEFFDLEELAETCKYTGRYTFFVTSSPLNVLNGIASPPNIMAIF
ncbi:hypothetical protein BT96DRAFT_300561 [Gymnopus androsaceus JB14]|uniref:Cyclase n=1 Tax=Gymnopus androsaceus JB14 TaxID=1447944 RepID=A0A6A4H1Q8_9AGAR|nr:hypothetical protein BT96DRAFT_300561 [Gymnopus androsaceus JB14]